MKKYKDIGIYDFSDYAEEITGDALFKINGGAEVENSHEGVAGAKPEDWTFNPVVKEYNKLDYLMKGIYIIFVFLLSPTITIQLIEISKLLKKFLRIGMRINL